jgi:hypothetical protein
MRSCPSPTPTKKLCYSDREHSSVVMFDGELTECPHLQRAATLPPGIWAMSWAEFWERYGYNSRRANLLSGLMFALKLLVRCNCQTIYIGGSFITNKERPNDIVEIDLKSFDITR